MGQQSTNLFTENSQIHANYRTHYAEEAIELILKPFINQEVLTVVEIGAGTGVASRQLADKGAKVIAVERNGAMIEAADAHPNVTYKQARAETMPLEQNIADVVTSFQAFHWFNYKESLKEFNRILKPAGRLALVWNGLDVSDPFTAGYSESMKLHSKTKIG